jgi:hypothetical protein
MTVFPFPQSQGSGDPVPTLEGEEVVELRFPARPDRLVLARLVTAAVASPSGFDVAELDDLRLAVDELCLSVGEEAAGGSLCLRIATAGNEVIVTCTSENRAYVGDDEAPSLGPVAGTAPASVTAELSERILDALVDSHGRSYERSTTTAWFRKRRQGVGP